MVRLKVGKTNLEFFPGHFNNDNKQIRKPHIKYPKQVYDPTKIMNIYILLNSSFFKEKNAVFSVQIHSVFLLK